MTRAAITWIVAGILGATGCAQHGMVDDGTTVAYGRAFAGLLRNGAELPPKGDGYHVPKRWVRRGNQYGTDELITMIVRVGRRVEREADTSVGVADLSPKNGGPTVWHRSHQTGRDIDLLMFAVDGKGRRLKSNAMVRFKDDGSSRPKDTHGKRRSKRHFDVERNWLLVRALLEEPTVQVQYIYVFEPLEQLLIEHAREIGEPAGLIEHAAAAMEQPLDSSKHDDHFHIRIYCPTNDRALGCEDGYIRAWHKKLYKYGWDAFIAGARIAAIAMKLASLVML